MNVTTHWLNRQRLTVYPRIVLAVLLLLSLAWLLLSKHGVDPQGKPLGYDFITFYAASKVALQGHASSAYNIALLYQAEKLIVPASNMVFVWYYPPPFYLLILPLARMPYLVAYAVFILATLTGYVLAFRRVTTNRHAMWCLAAFSGVFLNLFHGQNAFLTAALAAAVLLCLKHRPITAGVLLGLFAIKPHLAVLFPVALIAIGAWRTLMAAALTATAFTAISTAILGTATLRACIGSLRYAKLFLEDGFLPWGKMPTVFAFLRMLGTPVAWAYTAHAAVAAVAGGAVWYVWRRSTDWQLRSANLMTATFLVSPYLFDYDLAWLAFPIAWLALVGLRDGWLPGEREVLVLAWLLPLLMASIAIHLHLQIGPFVLGAMLWITLRRVQAEEHQPAVPAPARFVEAPAGLSHAS